MSHPNKGEPGYEEYLERQRKYRAANPERYKGYQEKHRQPRKNQPGYENHHRSWRRLNISTEMYNTAFKEQEGCCLICGRHQSLIKTPLEVDHDHNTGSFRGLLCVKCNTAIGLLNDDPDLVKKAALYLDKNKPGPLGEDQAVS